MKHTYETTADGVERFFRNRHTERFFWLLDTAMTECGNIGLSYPRDSPEHIKFRAMFDLLNEMQNSLVDPRSHDIIRLG